MSDAVTAGDTPATLQVDFRERVIQYADALGLPKRDVLFQSASRDPLNKGTDADHAKAQWFTDKIDATPGTVETYLDRAVARYGPAVVVRHAPPVDAGLEPVDDGDVLAWTDLEREAWLDAAREHRDLVPDGVSVPSDAEENL